MTRHHREAVPTLSLPSPPQKKRAANEPSAVKGSFLDRNEFGFSVLFEQQILIKDNKKSSTGNSQRSLKHASLNWCGGLLIAPHAVKEATLF